MSATLAALIRAHQADPRTLYVAQESDRVSTPGRYDATGSQRSPALDRRVEREAARDKFKELQDPRDLDPDDLDKVDDFEDLNDLLNGVDPDLRDPDIPEPELPEEPEPPLPEPPFEPPVGVGVRAYALHSGSISISEDGGATWAQHVGSPAAPIGFAVTGEGFYVATATSVSYSQDLTSWRELAVQGETNLPIEDFVNGSFEAGLSDWVTISGDSPRDGFVEHVIPTDGVSYLRRDWIYFTSGAFEVAQNVTLTPAERAAIAGGTLSFSGDVFGDGGTAKLRLECLIPGLPYFRPGDRQPAAKQDSDLLSLLTIGGTESLPDNVDTAKISMNHTIRKLGSVYDTDFSFRVWLRIDGAWRQWTSERVMQEGVSSGAANIRDKAFRKPFSLTLTSATHPGTISLDIPVGWKFPISDYPGGEAGGWSVYNGTSETTGAAIGWGNGWVVLASADRNEPTWERIAASVGYVPTNALRCVIKATGTPADVYVDNCRLEVVRAVETMDVTAIGGGRVAVSGSLYKLSPAGLEFERALSFDAAGITEGGTAWGGGKIFISDEEATYTLPQTVLAAFDDPGGTLLLMSGGEVWQRNNDPEFPGWTTLSMVGAADMIRAGGGWVAIGTTGEGFVKSSGDLATWTTASSKSHGNTRLAPSGMKLLAYNPGAPRLFWFDGAWHVAGDLKGGIIDISAG